MDLLLDNPVFNALRTRDYKLSEGNERVKYFNEEVSPFAGIGEDCSLKEGFGELHTILPAGRRILFATRKKIAPPGGWQLQHEVEGLQFVFEGDLQPSAAFEIQPLQEQHVNEMVALATLTKPGPFSKRTIEFGHYHGIFANNRLVAMTGQRLHPGNYTEISAVCTHPDHLGKGYAGALIQHQLKIILEMNEVPILHVRADNDRAIALYERLGFKNNGPMNFYFLKRKS